MEENSFRGLCPAVAAGLLAPYVNGGTERVAIAFLDAAGLAGPIACYGSTMPDAVTLPAQQLTRQALARGSRRVLIAHNHPSGDTTPSRADIAATAGLARLLRPLGITIADHLIICRSDFRSMRAMGLL